MAVFVLLPCDEAGEKSQNFYFAPLSDLDFVDKLVAARIELQASYRCKGCGITCLGFTKDVAERIKEMQKNLLK